MNQATLKKCRQRLEDIADRATADADALMEQARSGTSGKGASELSNAPMHLGDMGTEEYLYDLNTTLLENEQYLISEARGALRRIEHGTYGKCEACGKPIAEARLVAIPYARYCVRCAETHGGTPQVNLNEGRPQNPRDTLAPEGEMQEGRPRRRDPMESPSPRIPHGDVHAVGTAGGGTAVGGLAGSNEGDGDPIVSEADEAMGSGQFDVDDDRADDHTPLSGRSGGAVGGTPARKRSS
jgi:RNA polymerase-binding transcription factor DksA